MLHKPCNEMPTGRILWRRIGCRLELATLETGELTPTADPAATGSTNGLNAGNRGSDDRDLPGPGER